MILKFHKINYCRTKSCASPAIDAIAPAVIIGAIPASIIDTVPSPDIPSKNFTNNNCNSIGQKLI